MLADTKTVRSIVNNIVGVSACYTDKGAKDTRLLAWDVGSSNAARFMQEAKTALALAGFSNRVTTTAGGSMAWLRINASFK